MPERPEDARFQYLVGVSVDDTPDDLPPTPDPHRPPGWLTELRELRSLLAEEPSQHRISHVGPQAGGGTYGPNKLAVAKTYMPDATWLFKGYVGWALGVKSELVPVTELAELGGDAQILFCEWFNRLT